MDGSRRQTLLIMLAALLTVIVRSPLLLLHGRVVAEEGTVYFQQAWDSSAATALLALHQGYYSLFMNGLTLLAERLLPVEWFAITLTSASLLILLLTVYLAITCEIFAGRSRWLAAAVVLFVPAIEVWLTAEDMQFYLSACTALICLSSSGGHRALRSLTLLLAGLTGPVSCIFTPFFWCRAWRDRTPMAILQAAVLSLCSVAQAFVIFHFRAGGRSASGLGKLAWFGPVLFLKVFSVCFFGRLGAFAAQRIVLQHPNAAICLLFWLLALVSLFIFWRLAKMGGEPGLLCFSMALTALALDYTAIGEPLPVVFIGAFRYIFAGSLLLWLTVVVAYRRTRRFGSAGERKFAVVVLTLMLFWGVVDAAGYWTRFQNRSPDWQAEVAHWRNDQTAVIHVSPPSWAATMRLQRR